MRNNRHIFSVIGIVALLVSAVGGKAGAQVPFGTHDPSPKHDCGIYQWPEVQSPCPEVQIKQKHDHTPLKQYQSQGWDTAVTCSKPSVTLSCMPFIPTQFFNGQYTVDTIPYDPPDTTFARGMKMPVSTDDDFAASPTDIPFPFFFFGHEKSQFVLGANGLVTFNTASAGRYCPWKFSKAIPWPGNEVNGQPHALDCKESHMRDAIYGIYEDTHPIAAYLHSDQGIYYGVQGTYPCRKIICSWNGIPTFPGVRNKDNRCTYQIVCYEGSNIIEVHVKRRGVNSSWQSGRGVIGIQNATGLSQVAGADGTPEQGVITGAHPAYFPEGGNLLTTQLDTIAFRFSPQGPTSFIHRWYRLFPNGDTVHLTTNQYDTNGYYVPMDEESDCPTLTLATVTPTCVSRYVSQLFFYDAAWNLYDLSDTITIGLDTSYALTLRPANGTSADHQIDLCRGSNANAYIEFPDMQEIDHMSFQVTRYANGTAVPLPDSLITVGDLLLDRPNALKRIPIVLHPDATALAVPDNSIDSVNIQLSVDFISGCHNTADILVRTFPDYDTVEHHEICDGDTLHWLPDGRNYTRTTDAPQINLGSAAGCDSVVHLDLTVFPVSHTTDIVRSCKPVVWQNGETYDRENSATAYRDTIVRTNVYGCDSTVTLDFDIRPMTPLIDADLQYFDYDHLSVTLTDVSTGGDSRRWLLPGSSSQTAESIIYITSDDIDSVSLGLEESSNYGCRDTAWVTIPFRHDVIWMPNVFTPTAADNNRFGSHSRHLLKEEMLIYNRYGALVFECHEVDCQWDGTDLNGNLVPQGTYVYVVRYTTEYDPTATRVLKGTVTIID